MKGQSAIEFLSVYGFMFIVLGVVIAILVFFSAIPNNIIPSQCSPFGGLNCLGAFYYSNVSKGYSLVILRLSNAQSVPVNIISANVIVNTIDYAAAGNCTPAYVQPGQQFMCQIEFPRSLNPYISAKANYFISLQFCSQALSLQNKSNCDLYSDNVIYGGAISATVTPISIHYLPITLANSQSTPANTPFQEMISFNSISSGYDSYESANITNIEFTTGPRAQGAQIQAWIESGASSHAANTVVWLNLPFTIPAGASNTIYMNFLPFPIVSSSGPIGMAPQLSPTYAEYDNGKNVFLAYFNGDSSDFTVTSGYTLSHVTGITMPNGNAGDVIYVTGYASTYPGYYVPFVYNKGYPLQPSIVEGSAQLHGDTDIGQGIAGMLTSTTITSSSGIGVTMGFNNGGGTYFSQEEYASPGSGAADLNPQGSAVTSWVYGSVTFTGISSTSWTGYIAPQLYSTSGGYSGTVTTQPITSGSEIYLSNVGSTGNSGTLYDLYINWERARAYPPGGIMPSATFGSVTS